MALLVSEEEIYNETGDSHLRVKIRESEVGIQGKLLVKGHFKQSKTVNVALLPTISLLVPKLREEAKMDKVKKED